MKAPVTSFPSRQRTVGHYVSLQANYDSQAAMASLSGPTVRGFLKRYAWNSFEPTMGQYTFTELESDLAFLAARGQKLVVMILDKTFSGPQRVLPKGMEQYEMLNHGGTSNVVGSPAYGGYTAKRWTQQVRDQFNKLTAKLAAYDNFDSFEGMATCETSLSIDHALAVKAGYTPEAYRDSYIDILTTAARNLPRSQVFWFQNFLPGGQQYLATIAEIVRKVGVALAGPDVLPDSATLVQQVYPLYRQMAGRMTLGCQMSTPGYSQVKPDGTPMTAADMVEYMREVLFLNYCFWMPGGGYVAAKDTLVEQPVINP